MAQQNRPDGLLTGDDGFLALDVNGNFEIDDATELFGTATGFSNGFLSLAALDSNLDGIIDAQDAEFANLIIWKDTNANAVSSFDELFTLADFNIESIDLNFVEVDQIIAGHSVPFTSTVTYTDNSVSVIGDVFFEHDQVNTQFTGDFTTDLRTIYMPELRGFGELPSLRVAMSMDNDIDNSDSLLALVKDLTFKSSLDQLITSDTSVMDDVRDIMFRWAGVDNVPTSVRTGSLVVVDYDSRELAFLEKMMGRDFVQNDSISPGIEAVFDLKESFAGVLNYTYGSMITQIVGDELFTLDDEHELGLGNEDLQPLFNPSFSLSTGLFTGITGLSTAAITRLETSAAASDDPEMFWTNVATVIEHSVGINNLSMDDKTALGDAIGSTAPNLPPVDQLPEFIKPKNPFTDPPEVFGPFLPEGSDPWVPEGFSPWFPGVVDDSHDPAIPSIPLQKPPYITGPEGVVPLVTDDAPTETSPLVFDLDGQGGIELTALALTNNTFFDLDQDGFAEQTGWVTGGDGILAIDINGDGQINDGSELFGPNGTNGFTLLAELDSNMNGVIDSGDDRWNDLIMWVDDDEDARSTPDELHTLDDFNITSIDLNFDNSSQAIAGHGVPFVSTFTIDGVDRTVGDVFFEIDNVNTVFAGDYTLDVRTLFLPTLRGYGNIADLYIAMSLDNDENDPASLMAMITDLTAQSAGDLLSNANLENDIKDIFYRWAGVEDIDPDSRSSIGPYIDGRDLGFLEVITGQSFKQRGIYDDPFVSAGSILQHAFDIAFAEISTRLLAQTDLGRFFTGDVVYNFADDAVDGITGIDMDVLVELEAAAALAVDTEAFWTNLVRIVETTIGVENLPEVIQVAFDNAIFNTDPSLTLEDLTIAVRPANQLLAHQTTIAGSTDGNDDLTGTDFDNLMFGRAGDDILNGKGGVDQISGGAGDDVLIGELHDDLLLGGTGSDTYIYELGWGADTIVESFETAGEVDLIQLGAGIAEEHLTITRVSNTDMLIEIDTGIQQGIISIERQFNHGPGGGNIELLRFDDGSTLDLEARNYELIGTDGNDFLDGIKPGEGGLQDDTIFGLGGHDVINGGVGDDIIDAGEGNDTLIGGAGNDVLIGGAGSDGIEGGAGDDVIDGGAGRDFLRGGAGDDEYVFAPGFGADNLRENVGEGFDTIRMEGFNLDDVFFVANSFGSLNLVSRFDQNDNLSIHVTTTAIREINVWEHIEQIIFDDITLDTTSGLTIEGSDRGDPFMTGTVNNDVISGFDGNDGIFGGGGDDILNGGDGRDSLIGGDGNDILIGGAGGGNLNGGAGDDTYIYSPGDGVQGITERLLGGDDTIRMEGFNSTDVRLVATNGSVSITSKLDPSDAIFIGTPFSFTGTRIGEIIEQIEFDDTTWDLTEGIISEGLPDNSFQEILHGSAGDDIMHGGGGANGFLGAVDFLIGYAGNDTLISDPIFFGSKTTLLGGEGDDTYVVSAGDRSVEIIETLGEDTLVIEGEFTLDDLTFTQFSTILLVGFPDGTNITIRNQFGTNPDLIVEGLSLDGGLTVTELPNPFMSTNQPPVAEGDAFSTNEDTLLEGNVTVNDSDPDGDPISVEPDTFLTAFGGSVIISSTGEFTYDPAENFSGFDSFSYTLTDGELTDTALVTINIAAVNDAPMANDDSFTVGEDNVLVGTVLGNDKDIDGDDLTIQAATIITAAGAMVALNTDGTFAYSPKLDFFGADSFEYTVTDGELTDVATVNIDVLPINDAPVAEDDSGFSGDRDTVISGNGLLANDKDIEGDTLSVVVETIATEHCGMVSIFADGSFVYTPDEAFAGMDSFEYTVTDGDLFDTGTVTLNVDTLSSDTAGTSLDNVIYGSNKADEIFGLGGSDTIFGDNGKDLLAGGSGDDFLYGQHGKDTIYGGSGNDELGGGTGKDFLDGGKGDDHIWGGTGNDIINGGKGNDILEGEHGDDMISGGAGDDVLVGGKGADTFIFETDGGVDTVEDFNANKGDAIDITDLISGYDELTDAISDYVMFTDSGDGSVMSVDADGAGTNAGFETVANITNGAGDFDDLDGLIDNGNLLFS